ncbi:Ribosomal RNA small subunit methyltransferase I [Eikenella corrodens]|uniref:Ribosomal RNA small subunit methyltransferase I n=3 Tax=Eikenella corrodens TaxID=539 RepID=C0DVB6_EIKCO|nr:16S rRNA (cytidine(1402)-2'-O)-methyltransferase [Eikenella corrodens]EEG24020.1 S-adenosylmethionine-dependent methyltransferase, YraL family [Eikenella corrodens ATCC 23834]OAM15729.1 16S rRNA (cytidine(1402)-2'-O)-methyltransferase [Eikenella corrodens]UAK75675.1 16S rRNA (cytidine(1402)-2'-O)-methyltransferase [Eikenella corrodens]SNW06816.1 Ribosomal RNA small subunit methyltransferase I [Eikenella corrodens]
MWQKILDKAAAQIEPQTLYVVATPIGNLADITLRALAVLQRADLVCAEDTRVSQQLLSAYGIRAKLVSVREHNERQMTDTITAALAAGQVVAQISDAGTPAVCDPGARLAAGVREAGFKVVPVAGASAVMAALSVAGVTQSDFYFAGFLPPKAGERAQWFERWREVPYAVAMFETPHRIEAALTQMAEILPNRHLVLAREISKTFETFISGSVADVLAAVRANANQTRGEMVLVLHPPEAAAANELNDQARHIMSLLAAELPPKKAAALAAEISGANKKALYEWAVAQKRE